MAVIIRAGSVPPSSSSSSVISGGDRLRKEGTMSKHAFVVLAMLEKGSLNVQDAAPLPITKVLLPSSSQRVFDVIAVSYADLAFITKFTIKVIYFYSCGLIFCLNSSLFITESWMRKPFLKKMINPKSRACQIFLCDMPMKCLLRVCTFNFFQITVCFINDLLKISYLNVTGPRYGKWTFRSG